MIRGRVSLAAHFDELAVGAKAPALAGVPTDIQQGNLTIVDADGMYEQGTDDLVEGGVFDIGRVVFGDGVSLPVTFTLIPPSSPTGVAASR